MVIVVVVECVGLVGLLLGLADACPKVDRFLLLNREVGKLSAVADVVALIWVKLFVAPDLKVGVR